MLTLVKLGGSLITDKRVEKSFRRDVVKRLADEIAAAREAEPQLKLLIGHGSGSFGHFAAKRANTIAGVHSPSDWQAFAYVCNVAAELNYLVCECLQEAGLPVLRVQPSASMLAHNGEVTSLSMRVIETALSNDIIPVIYGDVSLDSAIGGTIISTEKLFFYLCSVLSVDCVFLLGEVQGVYGSAGETVSSITPVNFSSLFSVLGGSSGTDVTGGMETKVEDMLSMVQRFSGMTIRIFTGLQENLLRDTLLGKTHPGTLITNANT
jgi:isopentenyl phosphate kinase